MRAFAVYPHSVTSILGQACRDRCVHTCSVPPAVYIYIYYVYLGICSRGRYCIESIVCGEGRLLLLCSSFLASGFWLLASGYWLLAAGCWLLAAGLPVSAGSQATVGYPVN